MKKGKLFYNTDNYYVVITVDNKTIVRRAYDINKKDKTCNIRCNNNWIKVRFYM